MTAHALLTPQDCAVILLDEQAGLAFAAGSSDRQALLSHAVALAHTIMTDHGRGYGIGLDYARDMIHPA